jgi:uncharacterized membrane protein
MILVIYAATNSLLTASLTFSMVRLKKFSRLLVADGIIASRGLMVVHLATFYIVSTLLIIAVVLAGITYSQTQQGGYKSALATTVQYVDIAGLATYWVMMMSMMVMLVKYGTPMTSAEKAAISMRFILTFNAEQFAETHSKKSHPKRRSKSDCNDALKEEQAKA